MPIEEPLDAVLKAEQVGEVSGGGYQCNASNLVTLNGDRIIEYVGMGRTIYLKFSTKGYEPVLKKELLKLGVPAEHSSQLHPRSTSICTPTQ